jgi:hypothetical protein
MLWLSLNEVMTFSHSFTLYICRSLNYIPNLILSVFSGTWALRNFVIILSNKKLNFPNELNRHSKSFALIK